MKIALGGTRMVDQIPEQARLLLDSFIETDAEFLIGDARGIDSAFQIYLARKNYKKVRIYTSAPGLRNNIGNWPSERIESGLKSGHAMHSAKDRHITEIADLGLMIWDSSSAGTLANVIDFVEQGKGCYVMDLLTSNLIRLEDSSSLERYLSDFLTVENEARKRLKRHRKKLKKTLKENEEVLF